MAINFIRVSPTGFAPSTQVPLEYDNELVMDLCDAITSYEHDNDDDLYFWNILNAIYVQLDRQRGIEFARLNAGKTIKQYVDYAASKCGNLFLAHEGAARWGDQNIISVCQNPGNLFTRIYASENWLFVLFLMMFVLYDAKFGAYTMMFAGFSGKVTKAQNGCYIWPFGIIKPNLRDDLYRAIEEGKAKQFWEWCDEKVEPFM